jgi:hypothetical protein
MNGPNSTWEAYFSSSDRNLKLHEKSQFSGLFVPDADWQGWRTEDECIWINHIARRRPRFRQGHQKRSTYRSSPSESRRYESPSNLDIQRLD